MVVEVLSELKKSDDKLPNVGFGCCRVRHDSKPLFALNT